MIKISAIILTKNEEKNIVDCLDDLTFCDEIIVIDDNSSDRTIELIEEYKKSHKSIEFYQRDLNGDFSAQRNFGIEKTKNDWILFVDADERVSKELKDEINEIKPDGHGGFLIKRTDYMWGVQLRHGETGNISLLRLFDKTKGSLRGRVHEVWQTKTRVGNFKNPLFHYPHPTISDFLKEINFYTDLRAKELFDNKVKVNFLSILIYPKAKFINNFIFKVGFLDGIPGFVHALMMSFHSFLVRGKLWLLWQK